MPQENIGEKLEFLHREEIRTMAKDMARLREEEAKKERERIITLQAEKKPKSAPVPAIEKPVQVGLAQQPAPQPEKEKIVLIPPLYKPPSRLEKILVRVAIASFLLFLAGNTVALGYYFFKKLTPAQQPPPTEQPSQTPSEAHQILQKLSLEEKVGQLFIVGFNGKTLTPEVKNLIEAIHPGGVILFSKNIADANQVKKLTKDLQDFSSKNSGLPLFIATDQEGGTVRRIPWIQDKISQSEIIDADQAHQIGLQRGVALKDLGINLNLAPVVDITEKGDFLHARSFQKDAEKTGELAKSLILGQKESGIFTAVKHFPGYGGIAFNPETIEVPLVSNTPETFQFQKALEASPEFIMTANVVYSDIDEKLPFTLSPKDIQFLKEKLAGNYLVISDDLSSKVLEEKFSLENSLVFATKAGVDVLLVSNWNQPENTVSAFDAVVNAVKNGEIAEKTIDASVLKIIELKKHIQSEQAEQSSLQPPVPQSEPIPALQPPTSVASPASLDITDKFVGKGYAIPSTPRSIDTLIIHSAYDALGNNPYSVDGVIKEFAMYGVSSHYLIDRDGVVYRLVEDKNIAYHAGVSKSPDGRTNVNNFSIGIELIYKNDESPNDIQYQSLAMLIKNLKQKYSISSGGTILSHSTVSPGRKTDPWNFDWEKLFSLIKKP